MLGYSKWIKEHPNESLNSSRNNPSGTGAVPSPVVTAESIKSFIMSNDVIPLNEVSSEKEIRASQLNSIAREIVSTGSLSPKNYQLAHQCLKLIKGILNKNVIAIPVSNVTQVVAQEPVRRKRRIDEEEKEEEDSDEKENEPALNIRLAVIENPNKNQPKKGRPSGTSRVNGPSKKDAIICKHCGRSGHKTKKSTQCDLYNR